jgi:thiosulfate dehydrogenase (quinone) large subunit
VETVFLRFGLAVGFLSSVADRLGLWGPYGARRVAWGDMAHFIPAVAAINPWFPGSMIPVVAWTATIAEIVLGILLLIGLQTRWASRLSGWLLLAFALGMTAGMGVKSVLNYSVLAACGGAFMLATAERYAWSVDALRGTS